MSAISGLVVVPSGGLPPAGADSKSSEVRTEPARGLRLGGGSITCSCCPPTELMISLSRFLLGVELKVWYRWAGLIAGGGIEMLALSTSPLVGSTSAYRLLC
jgi:hypothetical protein